MKVLAAWMVIGLGVAFAGEEKSVLVNEQPTTTPVVVTANCSNGKCCKNCTVYNESVDEKSTCRKTIFGKVIRRDVKRVVLTPVR